MELPALLIGFFISSIYGLAFHLLVGGGLGRLVLSVVLAWLGFWAGHFIADYLRFTFASLGTLRLGAATAGSLLFLALGYWLSLVTPEKSETTQTRRPARRK
ncbi:MAG: hypothetical protein A2Z16_09825 [Chloroflexi bacterium RBG_16_54_18]|nr:MAG: hypothetical protein A2Z16_09825 [Chloroflexi bacterium RBG_16_54_18]